MTYEYKQYLAHHGIKGQKWGNRRYQNEDGSLTEEGKKRYRAEWEKSLQDKEILYDKDKPRTPNRGDSGAIKKWTIGSEGGNYAFAKWRERRHDKNIAKALEKGDEKRLEKYKSKKAAQGQANKDLSEYRKHTKTETLVGQNILSAATSGLFNSNMYRHARARGTNFISSVLESTIPIAGAVMRYKRDKKAYGKYIVYGNMKGESI